MSAVGPVRQVARRLRFDPPRAVSRGRAVAGLPPSSSWPRLLVLLPWLTVGGADRVHLQVVSQLRERGWGVDVLTTEPHRNEWAAAAATDGDLVVQLGQLSLRCRSADLAALVPLLVRRRGTSHVLIANCERAYRALPALVAGCDQVRWADLVHGQGGHIDRGGSPAYSKPFQHLLDARIVVSEYARGLLVTGGTDPSRVHVIRNGIAAEGFAVARPSRTRPVVGFLGRLSQEKRPEVLLEVAATLPEVEVRIGGTGPLAGALRAAAGPNVRFVGLVSDVPGYLAGLDALVLPSEMEGLPVVLLEAMAAGVAVVASRVGGVPELVTEGTGVLVEPDAPVEEWAGLLRGLLQEPEGLAALAERARGRVCDHFSLEQMGAGYDGVLRGLERR